MTTRTIYTVELTLKKVDQTLDESTGEFVTDKTSDVLGGYEVSSYDEAEATLMYEVTGDDMGNGEPEVIQNPVCEHGRRENCAKCNSCGMELLPGIYCELLYGHEGDHKSKV